MSWSRLSGEQQTVLACLCEEHTLASACRIAGVHPSAVSEWERADPLVAQSLAYLRELRLVSIRAQLDEWAEQAVHDLEGLLEPDVPADVRYEAAMLVLEPLLKSPA